MHDVDADARALSQCCVTWVVTGKADEALNHIVDLIEYVPEAITRGHKALLSTTTALSRLPAANLTKLDLFAHLDSCLPALARQAKIADPVTNAIQAMSTAFKPLIYRYAAVDSANLTVFLDSHRDLAVDFHWLAPDVPTVKQVSAWAVEQATKSSAGKTKKRKK